MSFCSPNKPTRDKKKCISRLVVAQVFLAPKKVPTHNLEPYPMVVSLARPKCWLCKVSLTRIFRGRSLSDDKLGMIVVWNNGLLCTLVPPASYYTPINTSPTLLKPDFKAIWRNQQLSRPFEHQRQQSKDDISSPVTTILNWDPDCYKVQLPFST